MKYGLVEVDWAYVGAKLSQESDDEQIKFFKSFVKECLEWGTKYEVEQQLAFVNSGLDKSERKILSMLGYDE